MPALQTTPLLAFVFLASCAPATALSPGDPELTDELVDIYHEVTEALADRGVTPEEAEAVALTGDENAVRDLLGWDADRFDDMVERFLSIAPLTGDPLPGAGPRAPIGIRCDPFWIGACVNNGANQTLRFGKPGLLLFAVWSSGCLASFCRIQRNGWRRVL